MNPPQEVAAAFKAPHCVQVRSVSQIARHSLYCLITFFAAGWLPTAAGGAEKESKNGNPPPIQKEAELADSILPAVWPAAKTPPASAPTLVVLPPHIIADEVKLLSPACELLCDALAAQLSASGRVRVVNRRQLERVLDEQKLRPQGPRALIAYDALVRLDLNMREVIPQLRVRVVDLSTGNPLGSLSLDWPLTGKPLPQMAAMCLTASEQVTGNHSGREKLLRVRLLSPQLDPGQPRLIPLAQRLQAVFQQSLRDSQRLELVQHLESGSAKEEALLILMGLARLEGERQFIPQADATLELRMKELDVVKTSFKDTPIDIDFRLRHAPKFAGEWVTTRGVVGKLDELIEHAWNKLAQKLGRVDPQAAQRHLRAIKNRRQQAEAELAAPIPPDLNEREAWLAKVRRAETALKIDPTFDPARLALLKARGRVVSCSFDLPRSAFHDAGDRFLAELTAMAADPVGPRDELMWTFLGATGAIRLTPLSELVEAAEIPLSDDDRRRLGALKIVCDFALSDIRTSDAAHKTVVRIVYRGMRSAGASKADRVAWLRGVVDRCHELTTQVDQLKPLYRPNAMSDLIRLVIEAAQLFHEDDATGEARAAILSLKKIVDPAERYELSVYSELKAVVAKLEDPELTRLVERWTEARQSVYLLKPSSGDWPWPSLFGAEPEVRHTMIRKPFVYGLYRSIAAIAGDEQRVYVLINRPSNPIRWTYGGGGYSMSSQHPTIAMLELDEMGHPVGKDVEIRRPGQTQFEWDGLRKMPQPNFHKVYGRIVAKIFRGKLYLANETSGLLEFDPERNAWRQFSTRDGLPTNLIFSLFPLSATTLYCTGSIEAKSSAYKASWQTVHFTLDVASGEVQVVRISEEEKIWQYDKRLVHLWRHENRWLAQGENRFYKDLQGAAPNPPRQKHKLVDGAEWNGRRFFSSSSGLHEFDARGKVIRSWSIEGRTMFRAGAYELSVPRLPQTPSGAYYLVRSGDLLVMPYAPNQGNSRRARGITAYHPPSDRWCGPFLTKYTPTYLLGTPTGIWIATEIGLCYISPTDYLRAAQRSGRVLSGDQFRTLQRHVVRQEAPAIRKPNPNPYTDASTIRQATPSEHARLAVQARDWATAAAALAEALSEQPDDSRDLLLAGLVHDQWGLKQPEKALHYYERLAQHSDRNAAFTGLYWSMRSHWKLGDYHSVLELARRLEAEFPIVADPRVSGDLEKWSQDAREHTAPEPDAADF